MLSIQNRKRRRLENKKTKSECQEDTNLSIVEKKVKKEPAPVGLTRAQKNAKRKDSKKQSKVREKKAQKEERERLLESLAKTAVAPDQLALYHSTCGRKITTQLKLEHAKHSAVIVGRKKKNKKDNKLEKLQDPITEMAVEEEESSSSEEDDAEALEVAPITAVTEVPAPAVEQAKTVSDTAEKPAKKLRLTSQSEPKTPSYFISVERDPAIQVKRLELPILGEEQVIMEGISDNDIVVIVGATGSGKTTQVPQFLFEAGYSSPARPGMIGVTEPRRVAAITTCDRVKKELNLNNVDYQIRYEGTVTPKTQIKFMTDGILLREVQTDFLLSKYSAVVIDEAHERSVNTDILIGLLSRVVPLRKKQSNPLKLIIMSATLRVTDFTENKRLFPSPPPVIDVGSRQHPVTIHYNKHTREDYVKEAYDKVCKIHRSLPAGDILVFLTGVQEINRLLHLLRRTFPSDPLPEREEKPGNNKRKAEEEEEEQMEDNKEEAQEKVNLTKYDPYTADNDDESGAVVRRTVSEAPEGMRGARPDMSTKTVIVEELVDSEDEEIEKSSHDRSLPLLSLPLYSSLPPDEQQKVFSSHDENIRLVVIATNVAETSLTIPGISYVVDSGKVKTKDYCPQTGMSSFNVVPISHASADQRAGRAGRTGPGHCYRLYSTAVMGNVMEEHTEPEILKKPIDGLVLQMKNINIHQIVNFPFPTPPSPSLLETAEQLLLFLSLLEPGKTATKAVNKITKLGEQCVNLPVSPRYAKLLMLSLEESVEEYALTLVAALSVGHLFTGPIPNIFKPPGGPSRLLGDFMVMLIAVGAWQHAGGSSDWCVKHNLRVRALAEIKQLRRQLTNIINMSCGKEIRLDPLLQPPTPQQILSLRRILTLCLGDHVAKLDESDTSNGDQYQCELTDSTVQINKDSSLYNTHCPYVTFTAIEEVGGLVTMRSVCTVEEEWLPTLLDNKCTFGDPLDQPEPTYSAATGTIMCHRTSTFGRLSWPLPAVQVMYPAGMRRYRLFAAALVEGQVIMSLQHYSDTLLARPGMLRKTWAHLQPRAEALLRQLVSKDVYCKDKLLKMWSEDPQYLLNAFSQWLPVSTHAALKRVWPPSAV